MRPSVRRQDLVKAPASECSNLLHKNKRPMAIARRLTVWAATRDVSGSCVCSLRQRGRS
jgi:hypothetical protein